MGATCSLGHKNCAAAPIENRISAARIEKEKPVEEKHEFATEEGQRLIGGARMEHYGPPQNNLNDIGETWTTYAKRALDAKGYLNGTDVSAMMVLMKVIRQARGYHRDSTVDVCGYAGLMEALNDPEAYDRFVRDAADSLPDQTKRGAFLAKLGVSDLAENPF